MVSLLQCHFQSIFNLSSFARYYNSESSTVPLAELNSCMNWSVVHPRSTKSVRKGCTVYAAMTRCTFNFSGLPCWSETNPVEARTSVKLYKSQTFSHRSAWLGCHIFSAELRKPCFQPKPWTRHQSLNEKRFVKKREKRKRENEQNGNLGYVI